MFANRRKRVEQNKILYFSNQLSNVLSPKQGKIPELSEIELWDIRDNNIYNKNDGNVGIGMTTPLTALDVSGAINSSTDYQVNYVSVVSPIGSVIAYTVNNAPNGWLICDGRSVSKNQYANLFDAIGNKFGENEADNTFNLPDYRGAFLRGTGTQGLYSGPSLNVSQPHATQIHNHTATSTVIDSGHSHTQITLNDDYNNNGGSYTDFSRPSFPPSDSAGSNTWTNIQSSTTGVSVTTVVGNTTSNVDTNETRPFNYGVYWIIKY